MTNKRTGFTLIELMIVVAIIGILASVGMPSYKLYMLKSRRAESAEMISALQRGAQSYYNESFVEQGMNGAELTQCIATHAAVSNAATQFIPAMDAAPLGEKAFGDFSTNATFEALMGPQTGFYYYHYTVAGSADMGNCGVSESVSDTSYRFMAMTYFYRNIADLADFRMRATGGQMLSNGGINYSEFTF